MLKEREPRGFWEKFLSFHGVEKNLCTTQSLGRVNGAEPAICYCVHIFSAPAPVQAPLNNVYVRFITPGADLVVLEFK